jgi:hypothetical protein
MTNQPTPMTTELAARLRAISSELSDVYGLFHVDGSDTPASWERGAAIVINAEAALVQAADELERLAAEVERLSGLIHSCPKCGEFCKQCRCWNDELVEARALLCRTQKYETKMPLFADLVHDIEEFLARTAEGDQPSKSVEKRLNVRDGKGPLGEDMKAIQGLRRANLIHEAHASCSLDGDTQSEGDSYVLISEDRLKRYESELASLREKLRRLEVGAKNV